MRFATAAAVLCCLLAFAACGRGSLSTANSEAPVTGTQTLTEVLADIEALSAPANLDPDTWDDLKSNLVSALIASGKTRFVSAIAPASKSTVSDLAVSGDTASAAFTWSYHNVADYDQNGEVNVSDLTPLGANLFKSPASPDWQKAQLADGDANGEVNISDITPIGANLKNSVNGYKLQYSADGEDGGTWSEVADIPTSQGAFPTGGGLKIFTAQQGALSEGWFRVMTYAGDETGTPSNKVQLAAADPTPGVWVGPGGGPENRNGSFLIGPSSPVVSRSEPFADQFSGPVKGSDGNLYCYGGVTAFKVSQDGSVLYDTNVGAAILGYAMGEDNSIYIFTSDKRLVFLSPEGLLTDSFDLPEAGSTAIWHSDGLVLTTHIESKRIAAYYTGGPQAGEQAWEYVEPDRSIFLNAVAPNKNIYLNAIDYSAAAAPGEIIAVNSAGTFQWRTDWIPDQYCDVLAVDPDSAALIRSDITYCANPDGTKRWETDIWADDAAVAPDGDYYLGGVGSVVDSVFKVSKDSGAGTGGWSSPGDVRGGLVVGEDGSVYWGDTFEGLKAQMIGSPNWEDPTQFYARGFGDAQGNFFSGDGQLRRYDAAGAVQWRLGVGGSAGSEFAFAADGTLYLRLNGIAAVRPNAQPQLAWYHDVDFIASYPMILSNGDLITTWGDYDELDQKHGGFEIVDPTGNEKFATGDLGLFMQGLALGSDDTLYCSTPSPATLRTYSLDGTPGWTHPAANYITSFVLWRNIAGDQIFFVDNKHIICIDAANAPVYDFPTAYSWLRQISVASDGTVYGIGQTPHQLFALNADGSQKWEPVDLPDDAGYAFDGPESLSISTSGDLYVQGLAGSLSPYLRSYDSAGALRWEYIPPGTSLTRPVVDALGTSYLSDKTAIYAVDDTGNQAWDLPLSDLNSSSPIIIGPQGSLYVLLTTRELVRIGN